MKTKTLSAVNQHGFEMLLLIKREETVATGNLCSAGGLQLACPPAQLLRGHPTSR